jgi:23S rRNA (adenine2503-C2)-methyltransferase
MIELLGLSIEELEEDLLRWGEKSYRAGQILKWLARGVSFEKMTDLPIKLRQLLRERCREGYARMLRREEAADGTQKYLLAFADGETVETVFMPKEYGNTVCVSTQVGCRMGCAFCASCADGLVRNLTAGEILAQVIAVNADNGGGRAVSHIVLMGMGEPLDNLDAVMKFFLLVNQKESLGVGQRNIALSTCGLPAGIRRLAHQNFQVTLAISLHASNQKKREKIMPVARNYPMRELIRSAEEYFFKTGRRVVVEYVVIAGWNDTAGDARELAELLRGLCCHVNLIPLNEWGMFASVSACAAYRFCDRLKALGVSATVRRSMGSEIEGGCGQLRRRSQIYDKKSKAKDM